MLIGARWQGRWRWRHSGCCCRWFCSLTGWQRRRRRRRWIVAWQVFAVAMDVVVGWVVDDQVAVAMRGQQPQTITKPCGQNVNELLLDNNCGCGGGGRAGLAAATTAQQQQQQSSHKTLKDAAAESMPSSSSMFVLIDRHLRKKIEAATTTIENESSRTGRSIGEEEGL